MVDEWSLEDALEVRREEGLEKGQGKHERHASSRKKAQSHKKANRHGVKQYQAFSNIFN